MNSIIKMSLNGFNILADKLFAELKRDPNSGWTSAMLAELERLIQAMQGSHSKDCDYIDNLLEAVSNNLTDIQVQFGGASTPAKIRAEINLLSKANDEIQKMKKRTGFDDRIAQIQRSMGLKRYSSGNDIVDFLQMKEIREYLQSKAVTEVYSTYINACRKGDDPLTVRAIESAPALKSLLSVEQIQQGKEIRFANENPFGTIELKLVEMQKTEFGNLTVRAEKILQDYGFSYEAKKAAFAA